MLPDAKNEPFSDEPSAYFGLWSARDIREVSDLLTRLGVRFETNEFKATEDVLKDWCAWDETSANPNTGFDLWVHSDDLPTVGTAIVDMFPERKFGA
ncbi:MAG: hypothetical protein ACLPY1_23405 [Terracidiphilus sp.]